MPAEAVTQLPPAFDLAGKRVYVAGHTGLVGSALVRRLASESCEVLTAPRRCVDLTVQADVARWFRYNRPDAVIVAAARVGGIWANATQPAQFLADNILIATNVIRSAYDSCIGRLVFLGSSCIYPREAPQPISEDALLSGPLEPTNEAYAIAKIAGIKLCDAYRAQYGADYFSAMPCNLYGPGDNFDLTSSHVLPALIRKAHEAKLAGQPALTIWGSGNPRREFLHVDDCADAVVHLLKHYRSGGHINVGAGSDITIRELAELVARVVGFEGHIVTDTSRPDGTPRKLTDCRRLMGLGWSPRIPLAAGIAETYRWYLCRQQSMGLIA